MNQDSNPPLSSLLLPSFILHPSSFILLFGGPMPTLLVIDDESNVLFSVETGLRSDELDVITADTGRLGIDLVRSRRPDAVLLDVRLGDMNGLEVFEQIRQSDPRLPVILLAAYATTETAIEAMQCG